MMPFIIPIFDRKAKQDLEVIRQRKAAEAAAPADDPDGAPR